MRRRRAWRARPALAEVHGPSANEELVGEPLAPYRAGVLIAAEFAWHIDQATAVRRRGAKRRPERVRRGEAGSLGRLRAERIDLLHRHGVDPEVPMEEVAGRVRNLIGEGKVACFDLPEAGPGSIRHAHAERPVTAVWSKCSLLTRQPAREVVPDARRRRAGGVRTQGRAQP